MGERACGASAAIYRSQGVGRLRSGPFHRPSPEPAEVCKRSGDGYPRWPRKSVLLYMATWNLPGYTDPTAPDFSTATSGSFRSERRDSATCSPKGTGRKVMDLVKAMIACWFGVNP